MPPLTFAAQDDDPAKQAEAELKELMAAHKTRTPNVPLTSQGLRSIRVKDHDPIEGIPLETAPPEFDQKVFEHFRGTIFENALQRTSLSLKKANSATQAPLFSLFNYYLVDELLQLSQLHNRGELSRLTGDGKQYLFPLVSARRASAFDSKLANLKVADYLHNAWFHDLSGKDLEDHIQHIESPLKQATTGPGLTKIKTYLSPSNWLKLNGPIVHTALGVAAGIWFPPLLFITVPAALIFGIVRTKAKPTEKNNPVSQQKVDLANFLNFIKNMKEQEFKAQEVLSQVPIEGTTNPSNHPRLLLDALYTFTKHYPEPEEQTAENFLKMTRGAFALAEQDKAESLPQEFLKAAVHLEVIRATLHKLFNPGNDVSKRGFSQSSDVDRYEDKLDRLYHSPTQNQIRMEKSTYEAIQQLITRLHSSDLVSRSSAGNVREQVRTIMEKLPWTVAEAKPLTSQNTKSALDDQLAGMDKVKKDIIRNAVSLDHTQRTRNSGDKSKVWAICLVGPPGNGKTSLAKAIAQASGRPFVIKNVGGIANATDLKGQPPIFIGSKNGAIVDGLIQAKALNPVFVLDEIDKLGTGSWHGSPSSALIDALDPDNNHAFTDSFLDIPVDLSKTLFVCTANDQSQIPEALKSRLLMIEVPGYLALDKIKIARSKMISKVCKDTGLTIDALKKRGIEVNTEPNTPLLNITDDGLASIIDTYSDREGGVRRLEKALTEISQTIVQRLLSGELNSIPSITSKNFKTFIQMKTVESNRGVPHGEYIGRVSGLSYNGSGMGSALPIQASVTTLKAKSLKVTLGFDKVGDGRSTINANRTVLSFMRKNAEKFVDTKEKKEYRIDILVAGPEDEVDGPSASIATAIACMSALNKKPVDSKIAITGSMDFMGKACIIGGVREKITGAYRDGCRTFMVPAGRNYEDALEDVPPEIMKDIKLIPINTVVDAMEVIWGKDDKLVRAFRKDKELSQLQASLDKQRPKYPPELAQKYRA